MRLDDRRGFVFDIDGTLVHRDGDHLHVQPGAREVLARIRASGRPLALFTNGSHVSPEAFAAELRGAGLEIADDEVLTPLRSVQTYLRTRGGGGSVLLLGNAAGREYLARAGVPLVASDEAGFASIVFVATPEEVDFPALEQAARAVLGGARLLTGSYAPAYAGANGPILSRGAMVTAALAKATSTRPVVVGKPSRAALRTIREHFAVPTERLAVIGDDVTMDVALGRLGRSRTILVRSGISGPLDLEGIPEGKRPDATVDGVGELLGWL